MKFSDRDVQLRKEYEKINRQLEHENSKLREDVKNLRELNRLQGKVTGGKIFKGTSVQAVGRRIMKQFNAEGTAAEFGKVLEKSYSYILNSKAKQTENKKLMGAYYFSSDYVCTMPDGRVIAPNYIERVFHSTITKSNLPQVTLHLLRHSVASNLLNDGFSVTQVQEWLGHSSAATTLTFYAHVDKTSKLQIANQLDKIDAENGFIQLESDKKSASEKSKKIKIRPAKRTK